MSLNLRWYNMHTFSLSCQFIVEYTPPYVQCNNIGYVRDYEVKTMHKQEYHWILDQKLYAHCTTQDCMTLVDSDTKDKLITSIRRDARREKQ
jgi:hypothetical protein